jgi:hypothetical protein
MPYDYPCDKMKIKGKNGLQECPTRQCGGRDRLDILYCNNGMNYKQCPTWNFLEENI